MKYNLDAISRMSTQITEYEIFEKHGRGVMESPYRNGDVVETHICSEIDAWIISEYKNIQKHGIISRRSSWESSRYSYRRKKSNLQAK